MSKDILAFTVKLIIFTVILFLSHAYLLPNDLESHLFFPLWEIYLFHFCFVILVFMVLRYFSDKEQPRLLNVFIGLTILKMIGALIFLIPVFKGKSGHPQVEIINFFIPYFLFLAAEISGVNNFLRKSK